MRLTTEQDRKDYYTGKIERLADELGQLDKAMEWLSRYRTEDQLKAKAEHLEDKVADYEVTAVFSSN